MTKFKDWDVLEKEVFQDPEIKTEYEKLPPIDIAAELIKARTKGGLSQQKLAALIGTSQSVIARLESEKYDRYTIKTLLRIAKAVNAKLEVKFNFNR